MTPGKPEPFPERDLDQNPAMVRNKLWVLLSPGLSSRSNGLDWIDSI